MATTRIVTDFRSKQLSTQGPYAYFGPLAGAGSPKIANNPSRDSNFTQIPSQLERPPNQVDGRGFAIKNRMADRAKQLSCFGKAIRRIAGGTGPIFSDRYHAHILKTPTETKRALAYVLQNTSKHSRLATHLDGYSSAPYFSKWKALLGRAGDEVGLPDYLCPPVTWLAKIGWQRASI